MELNTNTIGQRIRQRRNQLGLKQMEVKNAVGVSSGNMSDLENGNRLPSAGTLIRLSQVLHCSTDYILTGETPDQELLPGINSEEAELLRLSRQLSPNDREEILAIIRLKHDRLQKAAESA